MATLLEAANSGDRYKTLVSMRSILAQSIEDARSAGDTAHISAMVKQMMDLTSEISSIEKATKKHRRKTSLDKARAAMNG